MSDEEEKWQIPGQYRVDERPDLLAAADEQQKQWAEQVNSPLAVQTPRARLRVRAFGIVRDLEALRDSDGLTGDQHEILAEAYAETGRYDLAAETTQKADSREVYTRYWDAMNLPDDDWCPHHEKHKYVKEIVYSFKHGQEMPMLACNVCDIWNVADMPEVLEAARKRRAEVRHATKGMSIEQVKTFLQTKFRAR
jgi:hypothetical protein